MQEINFLSINLFQIEALTFYKSCKELIFTQFNWYSLTKWCNKQRVVIDKVRNVEKET